MRNSRSHFSAVMAAVFFLMTCRERRVGMKHVDSETYSTRACWYDDDGNFSAFMAFGEKNGTAVPYFISSRCSLAERGANYGQETIGHINVINMIDANGVLQREFPNYRISSNVITDQPAPRASSELYYVRGRVTKISDPHLSIYAFSGEISLKDTHKTLLDLFEMPMEQRSELAARFAR